MAGPLVSELLKLEGLVVYDSYLNCNIKVLAPLACFLADNARASDLTNHMGAMALKFCENAWYVPDVCMHMNVLIATCTCMGWAGFSYIYIIFAYDILCVYAWYNL